MLKVDGTIELVLSFTKVEMLVMGLVFIIGMVLLITLIDWSQDGSSPEDSE